MRAADYPPRIPAHMHRSPWPSRRACVRASLDLGLEPPVGASKTRLVRFVDILAVGSLYCTREISSSGNSRTLMFVAPRAPMATQAGVSQRRPTDSSAWHE